VDTALSHLFRVQMRLGAFDPIEAQPFMTINVTAINTLAHQQLALTAALEGIVLLKNNNNKTLPLAKTGTVAVIGPHAQATNAMQGNYYGNAPYLVSPQQGINKFVKTTFSKGCDIASSDASQIQAACTVARASSATIIVAGLDNGQESEGKDRTILSWPGVQENMIRTVAACSTGPVILVVFGGGPIDLTSVKNDDHIGAILWAGYPGQSGGDALAQIIFGDVSPSGRLPHTVYPANYADLVPETDMNMRPSTSNPGRTYRFFTGQAVYPFGYGLSYTSFDFKWTSTSVSIPVDFIEEQISSELYSPFTSSVLASLTCVVTNFGQQNSDVVVLAFVVGPNPGKDGNPLRQLVGFERVRNVMAGQRVTVNFPVTANDLSYVNDAGKRVSSTGAWKFVIEDSVLEVNVA